MTTRVKREPSELQLATREVKKLLRRRESIHDRTRKQVADVDAQLRVARNRLVAAAGVGTAPEPAVTERLPL